MLVVVVVEGGWGGSTVNNGVWLRATSDRKARRHSNDAGMHMHVHVISLCRCV